MSQFLSYQEMLTEVETLIREDEEAAEDRRTLSAFYNGRETMSPEKAESEGVRNVINHMLGFDSMNMAKIQVESIYTRGSILWQVKVENLKPEELHMKSVWENQIQQKLSEIIRKARRFKPEWKSVAGELPLFGNAVLGFLDQYDWCPRLCRVYVPRGVGILAEEIPHCAMLDFMTVAELRKALSCSKRRKELGYDSCWNDSSLYTVIKMLEGNIGSSPAHFVTSATEPVDEAEESRQMDSMTASTVRLRLPIYRFYVAKDNDDGTRTFDLVIMPRITAHQKESLTKSNIAIPSVLFHKADYHDRAEEFIHPMFVDCQIGGRTMWHRVMGLGRLNYDSDVEVEEFFSEALTGAKEKMRRVYQVATATDWELLKSWASGDGPSNVLPPGVSVADMGREPNFQHAMTPFQMLMQLTRRNSGPMVNNPGLGSHESELEVNALERQNRSAEALASRMGDIYECCDALGHEIFRRFLSPDILPTDKGYNEIKEFQQFLREKKIPIGHLRAIRDGKLTNVTIKASRAAGDGNTVQQRMANAALMQRLHLFPEEAQKIILRRVTAEETQDHDFAETVVPFKPRRDSNQITVSSQENDTMDRQGILGYVPPLNDDDLDLTHIEEHMRSMQADLERGKVRPWDKVDLEGFKVKGAHTFAHIERFGAAKENGEQANQMNQQLQALAKEGQEFENNLQEQEEKAKNPLSEKEKADLAMKERELQHKNRVQNDLVAFREKSLAQKTGQILMDGQNKARELADRAVNDEHSRTMSESEMLKQRYEDAQRDAETNANRPPAETPENANPTMIQ